MERVDSEIALVALLSTVVFGYPQPDVSVYPYIRFIAVGLLILTLIRRMGLFTGLSAESRAIRVTTYLFNPATVIIILYLFYVGFRTIAGEPTGSRLWFAEFAIVTISVSFVEVLLSEFVLQGPLQEGERIFSSSARQHRGEVLGAVLQQISLYVGQRRIGADDHFQSRLTRFHDRQVERYSSEELYQLGLQILAFFVGLLIPVLGYLVTIAGGVFVLGLSAGMSVLLFVVVLVVSARVRMWYSNYGLVRVEEQNGYASFAGEVVAFLTLAVVVA